MIASQKLRPALSPGLLAALLLLVAPLARAGEAVDDLLKLVSPDAALVVVGEDLERHLAEFRRSEFWSRLESWPAYETWIASEDYQKILRAEESIGRSTARPFNQLARELLGRAFVVAVHPQPDGRRRLIVIARTVGEKEVASAIEAWNSDPKADAVPKQHAGRQYFERTRLRSNGERSRALYYATFGDLLILAEREELIQRSLESYGDAEPEGSIVADSGFAALRPHVSPDAPLWCYVQPRACDEWFGEVASSLPGSAVLKKAWADCEALTVWLRADEGIVLEGVAQTNASAAHDNTPMASAVLAGLPSGALLSFAGDGSYESVEKFVASVLPSLAARWESYRSVATGLLGGFELVDVAAAFENGWSILILPHGASAKTGRTVDVAVQLEFAEDARVEARSRSVLLRDVLDRGLQSAFHFIATLRNNEMKGSPAVVRMEKAGDATIRWIEPYGRFEPCSALGRERLILATTRDAARRLLDVPATDSLSAQGDFERVAPQHFDNAEQILYVDSTAIRGFVASQHAHFVEKAMKVYDESSEAAEATVAALDQALRLFDRGFIALRKEESRTHVSMGLLFEESDE